MNIKQIVQSLCWLVFICKTRAEYSIPFIKSATNHIEAYTGIRIKNVVLLTSSPYDIEKRVFYDDFGNFPTSSRKWREVFIQYHHFVTTQNETNKIKFIQRDSSPTVVLINDTKSLNILEEPLGHNQIQHLQNKIWLITLFSEYKTQDEMNKGVIKSITIAFQKYFLKFLINAQVYVMVRLNNTTQLLEIYQVCETQPYQIRVLTVLSEGKTFDLSYIWQSRANLHQCPFNVAYFPHWITDSIKQSNDTLKNVDKGKTIVRQIVTLNGMTAYGPGNQMFAILHSTLNFSINWVKAPDDRLGQFDEESSEWNGLIGMIVRGEVDTFFGDISIYKERASAVRFATPHRHYQYRLFMQRKAPSSAWDTFLSVFDSWYWFALSFSMMVFSAFLFSYSIRSTDQNDKEAIQNEKFLQFCDAFGTSVKAFLSLDVNHTRKLISSRILLLVMCVCGMINFYVYNAGLISSLMVQKSDLPIKKFEDFLKKPKYKLVVQGVGASSRQFLEGADASSIIKQVLDKTKKVEVKGYADGEEEIIKDDTSVFFAGSPTFEMRSTENYPCKFTGSRNGYNQETSGYAFNKNSQYVDLFSYHITRIVQKGLETEYANAKRISKVCGEEMVSDFRAFSYKDVFSLFVILALGCLIAIVYSVLEYIYTRRMLSTDDADIQIKKKMDKELYRLKMFDIRAKEFLEKMEDTLKKHMYEMYKEKSFDFDNVVYERNQRYIEMINKFDQGILELIHEMFPPHAVSPQHQRTSVTFISNDVIQPNPKKDTS